MKHWYAVYTKPKKEPQVRALLQEQGLEVYLPTVRRKVRRRDWPERMVYFPCYLFVRVDFQITPRSSIDWLPGVRHIVRSGEQPTIVADEIIDLIRHRLDNLEIAEYTNFKPGDRVRITAWPLQDLEAVFVQSLPSKDRIRILLDVMGRMTPVEIDSGQVEKI